MLQTAGEEAQANGEQGTPGQGLAQALGRFGRDQGLVVFPPGTKHKQHDANAPCPQRTLAAEKAVVHGAGNKTDARILEQHGGVLGLKIQSHGNRAHTRCAIQ